MQIYARADEQSNVMLVGLSGEFDISTVPIVRSQTHALIADGWTDLLIDLADVSFVDSAGLGVLIGLNRRCQAAGGVLRIVTSSVDLLRLFEITELASILDVSSSIDTALASAPLITEAAEAT